MTPRFAHDCTACVFLGTNTLPDSEVAWYPRVADLYFCNQGGFLPTVIARYSDDGPDYSSGLAFRSNPHLRRAVVLATERGLLNTNVGY